ncbi:hypothetical protein Syn7502_03515 [Synechococcus sp. PCC 7502]|uniref:hypothetical protein n=1 Tax=Synechococcus sp. PCC 7502 TaxID=1173263 RepID=UPI00029FBEFB|nr:hypothetical protein [Synechococcus sp. PCC 7502]AFY75355.1 hypothetical protein Syn7502_03515 [Synechococcus sp. PCC 7502]
MERTEQEQLANLISQTVSQSVSQSVTTAIQEIWQQERSLLINEVNSHLTQTLKTYFEQQLATQRQELEMELQAKIDDLKFQHYQQLERLGKAVEQVITSDFLELDPDQQEVEREDLELSDLESESELFSEVSEEDDSNIELNLFADLEPQEAFGSNISDLVDSYQANIKADAEDSNVEDTEELSIWKESSLSQNFADNSLDENNYLLETEQAETEVFDPFATADYLGEYSDDNEFSLTDQSTPEPEDLENESTDLERLDQFIEQSQVDLSLNELDNTDLEDARFDNQDDSLDDQYSAIATLNDLLSLETNNSEPLQPFVSEAFSEEVTEPNFELDELDQDLGLFNIEDDLESHLDSELDSIAEPSIENIENNSGEYDQVGEQSEDHELNLFAESATLDILSQNEHEEVYLSTSDLEINEEVTSLGQSNTENSGELDLFTDTSLDENLNLWNDLDLSSDRSDHEPNPDIVADPFAEQSDLFSEISPEIVYEPQDEQFPSFSLIDEIEANKPEEFEALSESDRLNQELERELDLVSNPVTPLGLTEIPKIQEVPEIQEIADEELSQFADLETEANFWLNSDFPDGNAMDRIPDASATNIWHLGIDFGYSAIRACLFNQVTQQIYSLAWAGSDVISTDITANISVNSKVAKDENIEISLQGVQQFLRVGLPFQVQQTWQPLIQWTNQYRLSLKDLQVYCQELFTQIKTASHPDLGNISEILASLGTVILGHPHQWSDAYILNLREMVFASGLVSSIDQVLVIDQAIACLFPIQEQLRQLSINSGAFTTTISFTGSRQRRLESLEYAGLGINQDIVLELLYAKTKDKFPATKFIASGSPNPNHRTQLQRFLLNSSIGIEALAIAEEMKLWFSQQPESQSWQGSLGGKPIKILRSDWEVKVIQPFIQSINGAVDELIGSTLPEDITSIAIAGGTTQLPAVREWLESKFANAEVQELPNSNLAQGLAIAPLHFQSLDTSPEVNLEINRHQYSDYFLLSEICALNLQEPLSLGELIKKLQNRGVNAKACSDRLSTIISGQLPAGILPWLEPEKSLIAPPQSDLLDPQVLTGRLFTTVGNDLYAPNPGYIQVLGDYLKILESSGNQSFSEPLVFPSFVI